MEICKYRVNVKKIKKNFFVFDQILGVRHIVSDIYTSDRLQLVR